MKKSFVLCIFLSFLFAGCATNQKLENLQTRLNDLENQINLLVKKQSAIENEVQKTQKAILNLGNESEKTQQPSMHSSESSSQQENLK